jgi:DNA-binding winged helix-turn-helix (wHTH) protein/TolB-like protein/tetratricopeptide (TPR) repeat protein
VQTSPHCAKTGYRFADLCLETGRRQIVRGQEKISLTGLPFAILRELVEAAPNLVTHEELIERAWGPGRIVTPESLAQNIKRLRKALGDDAANPRYIEGVRGEGYRILPEVEPLYGTDTANPATDNRRHPAWPAFRTAGWIITVLVAAGGAWLWLQRDTATAPPSASPVENRPAIAVLDFSDSGAGQVESRLGTLLAEEIRDRLGDTGGLRVIADRSLINLIDADTQTIGRSLGVDYILEGTLSRNGEHLRIRSQLVDANTGIELWSDSYDALLDADSVLLADLAGRIVMMVGGTTATAEWAGEPIGPIDARALEDILRYLDTQGSTQADRLAALGHLESAVRREPDTAILRAVLSVAYNDVALTMEDRTTAARYRAMAQDEIDKAFDLAPDTPFVLAMMAGAHAGRAEWHEAAALFDRLVETSNPDTLAHDMYDLHGQFLRSTGRLEEAKAHLEYRRRIAPDVVDNNWRLIEVYAALGDFESAFELAEDGWQGQMFVPQAALSAALGARDLDRIALWLDRLPAGESDLYGLMAERLNDRSAALGILHDRMAEAEALSATGLLPISTWAAYFGDHALAVDALRRMPDEVKGTFVTLQIWRPVMAEARQLPVFKDLIEGIGLVAYWREWGWPTLCRPVGADDFECDRAANQ